MHINMDFINTNHEDHIRSFPEVACILWLEVFGRPQGDLPEDPSCLAGLASLVVLAVPDESKQTVSFVYLHIGIQMSVIVLRQSHQLIRTPQCLHKLQRGCLLKKQGRPFPCEVIPSPSDETFIQEVLSQCQETFLKQ